MFRYIAFVALFAMACANLESRPGVIAAPLAYSAGFAAPVAYGAHYTAPVVNAAYATPYAYSAGYAAAPVAGYPAYSAYSAPVVHY